MPIRENFAMRTVAQLACITTMLAITGCCDEVGCMRALLILDTQISTGADRIEVEDAANKIYSCSIEDEFCVEESGKTRSFSLQRVPKGELVVRIFAGEELRSEKVVTPVWKDARPDNVCGDVVCESARVVL